MEKLPEKLQNSDTSEISETIVSSSSVGLVRLMGSIFLGLISVLGFVLVISGGGGGGFEMGVSDRTSLTVSSSSGTGGGDGGRVVRVGLGCGGGAVVGLVGWVEMGVLSQQPIWISVCVCARTMW